MSQDPVSRMNYFSGEALSPADFRAEQDYHVSSREQLSQGAFSPGIVEGLDVRRGPAGVIVTAGKALDSFGRLLVLTQDTPCSFTLVDGRQNFVTINYGEQPSGPVTAPYGQGYKRWAQAPTIACDAQYDPGGCGILLAVIDAVDGAIRNIAYSYGAYVRRHVSAVLRSVDFVDECNPPPWPAAGIALNGTTLETEAPKIKLSGAVTAVEPGNRFAGGKFSGTFNGTFKGNGKALTLPVTSDWARDSAHNISYSEGNVNVGDAVSSGAYLTVRQGTAATKIGTGLISLEADRRTVRGYQTKFLSEVHPGDTLTYDYAPAQSATIDRLISPTQLAIKNRFPIDLGPSTYSAQRQGQGQSAQTGNGKVSMCGTLLTCVGGEFPTDLAAGDTIILDAFSEDTPVSLRVQSVDRDDLLTVTVVQGIPTQGGPKLSAFTVAPSILLEVGGVNPPDPATPPALVAAQNVPGATPPNSVGINGGSPDSSYAFGVSGPVLLEDDVEMSKALNVDGATTVDGDLTVTDSLTVDHTTHAVTAKKDVQVARNLTIGGTLAARNANTTLQYLHVTRDATIKGKLTVGDLVGFSVKYFGDRVRKSYPCTANSYDFTVVSGITVRTDGFLTVCLDTTSITCDKAFAGSLSLAFDGADAAMENYVAIWSEDAITDRTSRNRAMGRASPISMTMPLKKHDTYRVVFRTNRVKYDGVRVNVLWTPLGV